MKKKIRKAVIPAAGLGTRVLPATKAQPKEMLVIVDKPALQYLVEELIAAGIEEILIITGRQVKGQILINLTSKVKVLFLKKNHKICVA